MFISSFKIFHSFSSFPYYLSINVSFVIFHPMCKLSNQLVSLIEVDRRTRLLSQRQKVQGAAQAAYLCQFSLSRISFGQCLRRAGGRCTGSGLALQLRDTKYREPCFLYKALRAKLPELQRERLPLCCCTACKSLYTGGNINS